MHPATLGLPMRWYRRELDDFDLRDWHLTDDGHWQPSFPQPFPEPWRQHHDADLCLEVPREVCYLFADDRKMRDITRQEPDKTAMLAESIATEGLKVPLTMTWDDHGKIRYHDGYHRLTAMQHLENPTVLPIIFRRSEGVIRAFGLQPEHYVQQLFDIIHNLTYNRKS